MREYPLFVPDDGNDLAAVLSVPDGEADGLVLLLTGTGAPRSHRFQVWTRVARQLAERGLASIRMDYVGIGDSSGSLPESPLGELPKAQALAVARLGMRATGCTKLAVAGNCSGSLVALAVAADLPEVVGTMCILPRVLEPNNVNRVVIASRRSRLVAFVRSKPLLRRLFRRFRGRTGRPASALGQNLVGTLDHSRVLFMYSKDDTDAYNDKSSALLRKMVSRLGPTEQGRFELLIVEEGPLAGFDSIPVQDRAIEIVVEWLLGAFGRSSARSYGAARPNA